MKSSLEGWKKGRKRTTGQKNFLHCKVIQVFCNILWENWDEHYSQQYLLKRQYFEKSVEAESILPVNEGRNEWTARESDYLWARENVFTILTYLA